MLGLLVVALPALLDGDLVLPSPIGAEGNGLLLGFSIFTEFTFCSICMPSSSAVGRNTLGTGGKFICNTRPVLIAFPLLYTGWEPCIQC